MEFKKNQQHIQRRPRLSVPQRGTGSSRPRTLPADAAPSQDSPTTAKNIHINIHFGALPKLPSKSRIMARINQLFSTKRAVVMTCVVIVILISSVVAATSMHKQNVAKKAAVATTNTNKILENLEYQTVLPDGKSIDALGGWKRVSPPDSTAVYAYTDAIDGIAISVVQQPLPPSFKNDVDGQVSNLAKKSDGYSEFNAGSTKFYLGTSAKGPQSVILTKNGLLIIIKSQNKIDPVSWTKYIKSLN